MSRTYRSELRTRQASSTRDQILAAFIEQLADGASELSIPRVAKRAGVSVRTVYHHFPNRESQIAAVAEYLDARATTEPGPTSLTDLPAFAARLIQRAAHHPSELRAQLSPVVAKTRRRGREHTIARAVAKSCDAATTRLVAAALSTVTSAEVGIALIDRYHLEPAAAEATLTWMVTVVVDAIRRGDVPDATPAHKRTRR